MNEHTLDGIAKFILEHPMQAYGAGVLLGFLIAFVSMYLHYLTDSQTAAIVAASTSVVVFPCLAGLCWGGVAPLVAIGVIALVAASIALAFAIGWIRDHRWAREKSNLALSGRKDPGSP